jgi:hypothetical protein
VREVGSTWPVRSMPLWFLGPIALGLGFRALWVADRDGSHSLGRAVFAIVVGILSTIALIWLLTR